MTFKEKIIKLRKLKGLTQDELASAVGVSRQAVYKWESGQSYPEASKLVELKIIFNISIDDLLDESYDVVLPEKKKRKRLARKVKSEIEAELNQSSFFITNTPQPAIEKTTVSAPEEATNPAPVSENSEPKEPAFTVASVKIDKPTTDTPTETATSKQADERHLGFFGKLFGRK